MGVIGGPDGPAAVFVTATPGGIAVPALLAAAAIGAAAWLFLRRRKK